MNKMIHSAKYLSLLFYFLFVQPVYSEDNGAISEYLEYLGPYYFEDIIVEFSSIGSSSESDWPFNVEETQKKYQRIAKNIIDLVLEPTRDYQDYPLFVTLNCTKVVDNDAISCLINVKIAKVYYFYNQMNPDSEITTDFYETPQLVFHKSSYLYIDDDYFSDDRKSSAYGLSETIDKYFKEFLYDFVNKIIRYRKTAKSVSDLKD